MKLVLKSCLKKREKKEKKNGELEEKKMDSNKTVAVDCIIKIIENIRAASEVLRHLDTKYSYKIQH